MHTETAAEPRNATLTSRLAAACGDRRNHCALVLAVNVGLVSCAAAEPFTPALLLHLVLLPVNVWRLLQELRSGLRASSVPTSRVQADVRTVATRPLAIRCSAFDASATIQTIRLRPRSVL